MFTLSSTTYRDRVFGGWLGKAIGEAIGAQWDGQRRPIELAETADLLKEPRPRVGVTPLASAWLTKLEENGPGLRADDLSRTWLAHVSAREAEYGYARANLQRDLLPPLSGVYDNPFRESLGALARAEFWGLLAPGDPATAARYAWQDAIVDHAGTGVAAAVALAGLVSAAFAESSPERLVETALRLLPREARAAQVMRDVARWHGELANWRRTREMLLRSYTSEDVRDSTVALGFLTLALLDGQGDLAASLLIAARCGWSTAARLRRGRFDPGRAARRGRRCRKTTSPSSPPPGRKWKRSRPAPARPAPPSCANAPTAAPRWMTIPPRRTRV